MVLETVFWFLLVVVIIVFIHELGHFLFALKTGMEVKEFCVGFPPRLFSCKWKGVKYSLGSIPLGGFVNISGMGVEGFESENSFKKKKHSSQILVLFGGVLFNILLAFFLLTTVFSVGHSVPIGIAKLFNDNPENVQLFVSGITEETARNTGLLVGDEIQSVTVDGASYSLDDYNEFENIIKANTAKTLSLSYLRGDEVKQSQASIGVGAIAGIHLYGSAFIQSPLHISMLDSLQLMGGVTAYFFTQIVGLFDFGDNQKISDSFVGPVGIAELSADAASQGLVEFIYFIALLSLSLALFNLLPLPVLDGGRILFVLFESITGVEINEKVQEALITVSWLALMALIVYLIVGDIGL